LTDDFKYKTIKELYPQHHRVLELAGLAPKYISMLQQEVLDLNEGKEKCKEEKLEQDKQRNRSVYFCIGYSSFWNKPTHKGLKKLRNRFNLTWLQISMSYYRFPNLTEMFAGDLSKKLTKGVESMDFKLHICNCRDPRGTRRCQYGGVCRVPIVIYKITCKMTNKICIGNTQQTFKKRMTGPFQDVKIYGDGVSLKQDRKLIT
jgi:hypothetical protein